jgi:hypothetical protein
MLCDNRQCLFPVQAIVFITLNVETSFFCCIEVVEKPVAAAVPARLVVAAVAAVLSETR